MATFQKPKKLEISAQHWEEMRAEAERNKPVECCGLLAGTARKGVYRVMKVIPTTNILRSPVSYQLDPQEQLKAFIDLEERGWELAGIYHSHPQGPEEPSPTDISEAYYPEAVYLVWCGCTGAWTCRGFLIQNQLVREIPIQVKGGKG